MCGFGRIRLSAGRLLYQRRAWFRCSSTRAAGHPRRRPQHASILTDDLLGIPIPSLLARYLPSPCVRPPRPDPLRSAVDLPSTAIAAQNLDHPRADSTSTSKAVNRINPHLQHANTRQVQPNGT